MTITKRTMRSIIWWSSILIVGGIAWILGFLGFSKYYETDPTFGVLDRIYVTWQLFTMESGGVQPPIPWTLEIARILAPLTAASALIRVILALLRDRMRWMRLAATSGHVVVVGLGRRGIQLCADARKRDFTVVALDEEISEQLRLELEDDGVFTIEGDASRLESLRQARTGHASHVFAVAGEDGVNVEVALNAHQLVLERDNPNAQRNVCHVQVSDVALASQFKEIDIFKRTDDAFEITQFSSFENAARVALTDHPLDYERIQAQDTKRVRLILFGFGEMGESLAIQAVKNGHYANGALLDVHAFDVVASDRQRSFALRYPQFSKCGEITFHAGAFEDPATVTSATALAKSAGAISTVALCFDSDSKNVQYALHLRRALGDLRIPILVRLSEEIGLARLIRDYHDARVQPFGMLSVASSWAVLMGEETDRMAQFIHEQYVEDQRRRGKPEGPNTRPWNQLHHELRESNRAQADHIPVKLRALGHDIRRGEEAAGLDLELTDEEVETLARMEHARWNTERFLAGWELGEKDIDKKRSPYLVPYDELPDEIKQYDRDSVRNIVATAGKARG